MIRYVARRYAPLVLILALLCLAGCSAMPTRDRPPLSALSAAPSAQRVVIVVNPESPLVLPDLRQGDADDEDEGDDESDIDSDVLDWLWNRATEGMRERVARPAQAGFDREEFARHISESLRTRLPESILARDAEIVVANGFMNGLQRLQHGQANLLLNITTGFNYTLEGFFVETEVSWFGPNREQLSTRYVSEFVNGERYGKARLFERRKPNADYWSANGGAAMQRALDQAGSELAQALATDFVNPQPIPGKTQRFYSYAAEQSPHQIAAMLDATESRMFVVTRDGQYWLDRIQIDRPRLND